MACSLSWVLCLIQSSKMLSSYLSIHCCPAAAAAAKLLQSYPTLCGPLDRSPLGSSVSGILQARILEWVAISFSNAWKWKVKVKLFSRARLLATLWTAAYQAPQSMGFTRQEYWSGLPLPSPLSSWVLIISCIPPSGPVFKVILSDKASLGNQLCTHTPTCWGHSQIFKHQGHPLPDHIQFSSVQSAQSCPTLCDPMNRSTPGLPVHHQHPEFTQTHVHRVSDAIQPSHPLSSPSPPVPNPSQHQSLFQLVSSSHEVAKSAGVSASESFPPKKSQGWSPSEWTAWISLQSKGLTRVFSNTTDQKHQFFGAQPSSQSNSHIHTWPLEKP